MVKLNEARKKEFRERTKKLFDDHNKKNEEMVAEVLDKLTK